MSAAELPVENARTWRSISSSRLSRPRQRSGGDSRISFEVGRGESFGLVGESGCGKSTVALALVRYLPRNGSVTGGSILIDGRNPLRR